MRRPPSRGALAPIVLALCLAVFALPGCVPTPPRGGESTPRSVELTAGEFPETSPPRPEAPPPPMLRDPKSSVYSYLLWISYAYRVLDSDVASMTFSPSEEVRVNSYVELNRQEGRALDQRLVRFDVRSSRAQGDTATVGASEWWRYRYIDMQTGDYATEAHDITYETTYTVVRGADGTWVVDHVSASPSGAVPK